MLALLHLHTPLDPLHGDGYQFWSGIGFSTAVVVWWRKHNCHRKGCPFFTWHESDAHDGHPVCRLHHNDHHGPLSRLFCLLNWDHGDSQ